MTLGIVILAAGQGTRMRSTLPKVLHPLAGKPILGHVLDTAFALNPQIIVVVYGHGGEHLLATFSQSQVEWVEQKQQLGTAHAVQQAMPKLVTVDQVLILYGDVPLITTATLHNLIQISINDVLGIITAQLSDPTGYGRIIRDDTRRIVRIVEQKDATSAELMVNEINTGIMLANRSRLSNWLHGIKNNNAQSEFYLTDVIAMATEDGVTVASVQPYHVDEILGINDRIQLAYLERQLQLQQAQALMRKGVTIIDPARFDLRGSIEAEIDIVIDINVIIEGHVILKTGVSIGANCILRNCTIGVGTVIYANSIIDNAIIGANCRIGPYARIRPGCELAEKVHIGNFVELKNAKLGMNSKANHLTYLGDCEIGEQVNIGAGTIICNYDGVNKYKTVIGNKAFIGSNTALVAPVTIGENATIGAGSVITIDAPAGELTLSRAKQHTITGWVRRES